MYDDTQFGGQVVENPNVVVADEPVYFDTAVGEFGDFSEKAGEAARHRIFVFVPVVEHVAKQIQYGNIVLDAVEPAHRFAFALALFGRRQRCHAQMEVGDKIDGGAHAGEFLEKAEFEFRLLAHHVFIPFRLENEIDGGGLRALDACHFLAHVFGDEVGGGAVGGGERHVDDDVGVVVDFDFIDKSEIIYIDRNFRVVNGAQHLYDFFFYFERVCHAVAF